MASRARRLQSIRAWLLALVLAALLPGVLGAAALLSFQLRQSRLQLEYTTAQTTRALSQAVDHLLLQTQAAGQALATSDSLARGDLATFHAQAREMIARTGLGNSVVLRDRAGVQILNTLLEFGAPNPAPAMPERVAEVFETARPVVHDLLLQGRVTGQPVTAVDVPVFLHDEVVYALAIAVLPAQFDNILLQQSLPPTWLCGVPDGSGRYVARAHAKAAAGQMASSEVRQMVEARLEGKSHVTTASAMAIEAFHSRSTTTGWSVVIGIPESELNRISIQSALILATGVAGLMLMGLLLTHWIARHISRSLRVLGESAAELGSGEVLTQASVDIKEAADVEWAMVGASRLLSERTDKLQEADRRKNEFIALLAHELRNPLAPIRNAVEILRRQSGGNARLERSSAVIARQVTHMARLIEDLLDTSRIVRGKLLLQMEDCDLASITAQTVADYATSLEALGLRLKLHEQDAPLKVRGDPVRLAQMVGNLLTNAGKFNTDGGWIEVTTEADLQAGMAVVRVIDSGIGLSKELIDRLFQPFVQGLEYPARSRSGLGLGLSLTRGLARLQGGDVSVTSEGTGRGATFSLHIPLAAH